MVDSGPIPTKVALVAFTINGTRCEPLVNVIRIYEDICKPYRTAIVGMVDNDNLINNLNLQGGETVSFVVWADGGGAYQATMGILKIKKQKPNYGLRTNYYDLDLVDFEYFGDRRNLVQKSFMGQTGTSAISWIHDTYLGSSLNVLTESAGMIGGNNPYTVDSKKPFTAIDGIRRLLTFPQAPSGASVYYHDNTNVKFAALEYLLNTVSPAQNFRQKATWGADWADVFSLNDGIFASESTTTDRTGSASIVDKLATESAERMFSNMYGANRFINQLAGGGSHGGRHNYQIGDSEKIPNPNVRNTPAENALRARVGDGIHLTVKVPAQTGFNVTVGGGFSTEMQPNVGDLDAVQEASRLSGNYLAIKLVHDLHFDMEELAGTTSVEGLHQ